MARIFLALALFAIVLLIANLSIGLSIGDYNAAAHRQVEARRKLDRLKKTRAEPAQVRQAEKELASSSKDLLPVRRRYGIHSLCGLAAALVTLLVNSIAITYFVGTSRWCREVVETYHLDIELALASQRLKRKTFPWALAGMLTMLAVVALGAASDPGANFESGGDWVTIHMMAACLGTAFILWSFLVQVGNIGANYEIIEKILAQVQDKR